MALQVHNSKDSKTKFPLSHKDFQRSMAAWNSYEWKEFGRNDEVIYYYCYFYDRIIVSWSHIGEDVKISDDCLFLISKDELFKRSFERKEDAGTFYPDYLISTHKFEEQIKYMMNRNHNHPYRSYYIE